MLLIWRYLCSYLHSKKRGRFSQSKHKYERTPTLDSCLLAVKLKGIEENEQQQQDRTRQVYRQNS